MNIIRWQRPGIAQWPGFDRLSDLRDEIDRLFDSPLAGLVRGSSLLSGWNPALDVYENKDNFVVVAELPGMKKEDIDVSMRRSRAGAFRLHHLRTFPVSDDEFAVEAYLKFGE